MTEQPARFICPHGGCDAHGYCPCAEDEPDEDDLRTADDIAEGRAVILRGRIRDIDTLPPIDNYNPTRGTPCPP